VKWVGLGARLKCLPSKGKALNSNPSSAIKNKNERKKGKEMGRIPYTL
jgi:hypothetical protein